VSKGHVPEENLWRYRILMNISRQFDSLANSIGAGDTDDMRTCYRLANKYRELSQQLRVDLPEEKYND
jgi:hypothetical protein